MPPPQIPPNNPALQSLTVQVRKVDASTAIQGAVVTTYDANGVVKYTTTTPASGNVTLNFLSPPAFVGWKLLVAAKGYAPVRLPLDNIRLSSYTVQVTMNVTLVGDD